jgi:Uncharacterized conserved protein
MMAQEVFSPLQDAYQGFVAIILSLTDDQFLCPLAKDEWAPRDVVAHLVGWNDLMIEASRSIVAGNSPAYYADSPNDYCNINAGFTSKYSSRSRQELLADLRTSLARFEACVLALPQVDLTAHHGVRHYSGDPATVTRIISSLAGDYRTHTAQIREWLKMG